MLIPDGYINIIQERLNLYNEMGKIADEEALNAFRNKMKDKFGPIPFQVDELFNGIRLRWICKELGIERLSLKSRKMRCYFVGNAKSSFYESPLFDKLMKHISTKGPELGLTLKQSPKYLIMIKDGVNNLKSCRKILENLQEDISV